MRDLIWLALGAVITGILAWALFIQAHKPARVAACTCCRCKTCDCEAK